MSYSSLYTMHEASKRVAECFFKVDELSSFHALGTVFVMWQLRMQA